LRSHSLKIYRRRYERKDDDWHDQLTEAPVADVLLVRPTARALQSQKLEDVTLRPNMNGSLENCTSRLFKKINWLRHFGRDTSKQGRDGKPVRQI
jgi:hypothetical protein